MQSIALMVESLSVAYSRRSFSNEVMGAFRRSKVERLEVLKDVSFSALEGDIIGVLGANGAGKSTLFDALANRVDYDGTIRLWSEPRLITLERSLPLLFSGRQHIELIVSSLIKNREEAAEQVSWAIEFSELGSAIDAPMKTYSKGMRSRVTFSALTVGQPRILLIDEALAVGDRQFTRKAMRRIRQLSDQSSTVLICDHNLRRLELLCTRGLAIRDGSIVADASIADAISHYEQTTPIPNPKGTTKSRSALVPG